MRGLDIGHKLQMDKIVPRSLSEEKARAGNKRLGRQLLGSKTDNTGCEMLNNSMVWNGLKIRDSHQYQKDTDFILGVNSQNPDLSESITQNYDPLKETACFKFVPKEASDLPALNCQSQYKTKAQNEWGRKGKIVISPVTPLQGRSFDRNHYKRREILSENQSHRKHIFDKNGFREHFSDPNSPFPDFKAIGKLHNFEFE